MASAHVPLWWNAHPSEDQQLWLWMAEESVRGPAPAGAEGNPGVLNPNDTHPTLSQHQAAFPSMKSQ